MAKRSAASRERFVEATEALLRERGLAGTGIQQVVARSGAPTGSLYHFFPGGKSQLAVEALRLHGARIRELLQAMFTTPGPLPEQLRALFRTAAKGFDNAGGAKGCAIGAVALDLGADDDEIRGVCQEIFDGWIDEVAPHLPWAGEAARRSFAEMIVVALEGAFVLGRARRQGEAFLTAGEWLAAAVEPSRRDR